ncbi:C-type lectin domain family 10 member A [Trichoplax sp. H2]|nr:C-type lectin domain family 10 member A [Trichoplax sp. H2]|eukprot:RDD36264.1 C-type lectin domain family 10 member A [Trichoplax sp. H2]
MKYENASKYCQGINSSLVEIDSAEKEAFIGNSISDPSTTYWLGLVDLVGNDDFNDHIWVQSNRSVIATGYQNWGPYDPDNKFHRCVISSNLPPYVWLDRNCEDTYNTICEKNSMKDIMASSTVGYPMSSTADPSTTYWLGLVDLVGNDDFNDHIWVQSNRSVIATGYQNWGPYDPDNKFHRCVISSNLPPYLWRDRNCEDTYNTICEKSK